MSELRIELLTKPEAIMALWPDLLEVPLTNISPNVVMAKCLAGEFEVIIGKVGVEPKGFMIFYQRGENLDIVALHLRHYTVAFLQEFCKLCHERGVKRFFAISSARPGVYRRLIGMKELYTTYMYEVE